MRLLAALLLLAASAHAQTPLVLDPAQPAAPLADHAGLLTGGPTRFARLPRTPEAFRPVAALIPADLPEAFWLRVPLRSAADRPTQWILALSFADVAAVLVHADGRRDVLRTGTRVALAERTFPAGRPSGLRLDLGPREEAVLYLRVRHRAGGYTDVVVPRPVEADAFARSQRRSDSWNGLVLGVLLALSVYNLFLFGCFRDRSYLFYVVFLLATAAYWAITWGYVVEFAWPASSVYPPEVQFFALVAAGAAYAQFARLFLKSARYAPRVDLAIRGNLGMWAVATAFGLAGMWAPGQLAAAAAGLSLLGATLAAGVVALRAGFRPARAYLAAASLFLIAGTVFAVRFVVEPAHGESTLPLLQASMLAEALGLAMALSVRIRLLHTERAAAIVAREQAEAERQALREASDLKTHLLGITAHDLRSPLTSIAGAAEMIDAEAPDRADLHDLTDLIQRGAARMLALVDDLLVTAALDGGQIELERAPVDVAALARDVVMEYAPRVAEKGQTLALERPEAPLAATVDATRVRAVLDNLVSNAVKYTPLGGRIRVSCTASGADVRIGVSDDGPGLGADDVANLFQRFRRLSPRPTGGESSTGLGLSIAHEFVALHGGRIEVESALGAGTTFTVVLPAVAPQSASVAPRERGETPRVAAARA